VGELKASISWEEVVTFNRIASFYEQKTGRRGVRKFLISPFVSEKAKDLARRMEIEVFTEV
jgi:hypothetical protein